MRLCSHSWGWDWELSGLICFIFADKTFQRTPSISFHSPSRARPSWRVCKNSHISRQQPSLHSTSLSLHNAVSQINQMVAWDGLQSQAGPQPQPPPDHRQLHPLPHLGEPGGGGGRPGSLYFSLCFIHVLDSAAFSYTILVYTWSSSISNYHTVYLHTSVRREHSSS